jgi:RNA polymerase sigma-70 factor (ECF subfamily)
MSDSTPVGLDEFFRKEYVPLVAFAQRRGVGLADAEDAVQQAFQALTIAWNDVKNPAAWMRLVVRREVIRKMRNRWRFRPLDGFEASARAGRAEPDERDGVLRLIRRLSRRQAAVLAWVIDGYAIAETAQLEGIDEAEVRKVLRQARTRLARLMREN